MASQSIKVGQITPCSYNAGFIVLAYMVSWVGCITTLELLHRRTSRRVLYNWYVWKYSAQKLKKNRRYLEYLNCYRYLLVTSSIGMGGNGIWCMHFIGNLAILLADGDHEYQIVYSSSFTAVSFFLPITVLLGAFYLLGVTERDSRYYIGLSGTITGLAVCGMHYVGQLGIANYHCSYHKPNVVGAAAIAVFASLVALSVFFRLRAQ